MKHLGAFLSGIVLIFTVSGCMHTYVAGGLNRVSPDKKYRISVVSHGASAKAYVDKTKKRVYLGVWEITTNNVPAAFQSKHIFIAADLWWKVQWLANDRASVTFYDYGDKVSRYEGEKNGMISNHIATITLQKDEKTGRFVEQN